MANNPFLPEKGYKAPITEVTPRDKVVLVFHEMKEHLVESDPDDATNFLTVEKAVVAQRIPLNEYIQQFDRETDLKEKIARIHSQEEFNDFIAQTGLGSGQIYEQQDYLSDIEIEKIIEKGELAWNTLDADLKKGMDKETFVKSFNQEYFNKYIQAKADELVKKDEVKENA